MTTTSTENRQGVTSIERIDTEAFDLKLLGGSARIHIESEPDKRTSFRGRCFSRAGDELRLTNTLGDEASNVYIEAGPFTYQLIKQAGQDSSTEGSYLFKFPPRVHRDLHLTHEQASTLKIKIGEAFAIENFTSAPVDRFFCIGQ